MGNRCLSGSVKSDAKRDGAKGSVKSDAKRDGAKWISMMCSHDWHGMRVQVRLNKPIKGRGLLTLASWVR